MGGEILLTALRVAIAGGGAIELEDACAPGGGADEREARGGEWERVRQQRLGETDGGGRMRRRRRGDLGGEVEGGDEEGIPEGGWDGGDDVPLWQRGVSVQLPPHGGCPWRVHGGRGPPDAWPHYPRSLRRLTRRSLQRWEGYPSHARPQGTPGAPSHAMEGKYLLLLLMLLLLLVLFYVTVAVITNILLDSSLAVRSRETLLFKSQV